VPQIAWPPRETVSFASFTSFASLTYRVVRWRSQLAVGSLLCPTLLRSQLAVGSLLCPTLLRSQLAVGSLLCPTPLCSQLAVGSLLCPTPLRSQLAAGSLLHAEGALAAVHNDGATARLAATRWR